MGLLPTFRHFTLYAGALGIATSMWAQTAVTGVTYGALTDNANITRGGITYLERTRTVNTVASGLGDYQFTGPTASNIYFRRNTGAGNMNNTTIFYQNDGSNRHYGTYESNPGELFLSNNLYQGIRNPFENGTGATQSNIERIDFYFSGGYTVQENDGLVFFDLENSGNFGDGFRLAAFTSVDGGNTPTAYANTGLLVAPDSFGGPVNNPQLGTPGNYRRATFANGDNLSGTASGITSIGSLELVGILIRFSDLGITAGTTIQGFSLMAGDVAPTAAADLVNWNSAAYYPTNTSASGIGYGNMDFMGFGSKIARPVPEPSTYGAIFAGLLGTFFGWRRLRRAKLSAPAA
jgi:PEP-CTERM motif